MKQVKCEECNYEYVVPEEGNTLYMCPKCYSYVGCVCEYGFGSITPCTVYLGKDAIAHIHGNSPFHLQSLQLNINQPLEKGSKNLEVYKEAVEIIKKNLQ